MILETIPSTLQRVARWLGVGIIPALLLGGCVSQRSELVRPLVTLETGANQDAIQRAQRAVANLFPPQYRATQRAIVTVGRRQFTCDGVLTASPVEGHHLAVVSSFGVVTDLRVKSDGACEILKVTPLLREDWSRQFVARDLRWLFAPPGPLEPAGWLADGRLVLQTRPTADGLVARYIFNLSGERLQELELVRNARSFYRVSVRRYRAFAGSATEVPCEFEVSAESYHLNLRIAELRAIPAATGGTP